MESVTVYDEKNGRMVTLTAVNLSQVDFDKGGILINEPGLYSFAENITWEPGRPKHFGRPNPGDPPICSYRTAITVTCRLVIIDGRGHQLRRSSQFPERGTIAITCTCNGVSFTNLEVTDFERDYVFEDTRVVLDRIEVENYSRKRQKSQTP